MKIEDKLQLRPRYGEVDQMGYVYHANYVSYCHQARTELLRKLKIDDKTLEAHNIMLPVISMNLKYIKPVGYDDLITIKTTIEETPVTRFKFQFEITNEQGIVVCTAESSTAIIDSITRKPMRAPDMIKNAFQI
ncbi:acyl-CoA thioesterase [Sunxiuqinia sp. A32]|uniref:acyl-CoA thioesterase n=1 Tax=Sunxiuqinia sp. A32 TaxID=3461496 RepID=UPI004045C594